LQAPSTVVARIQEIHALCVHIMIDSFDARMQTSEPRP